jgi:hypothetical protein
MSTNMAAVTSHIYGHVICCRPYHLYVYFKAKSTIHKAVYATVTITISDINDNAPQFSGAPYRGTVSENSPTGLTVLRVSAQDVDSVSILHLI